MPLRDDDAREMGPSEEVDDGATLCEAETWQLLLGLRDKLDGGSSLPSVRGVRLERHGGITLVPAPEGDIVVRNEAPRGWVPGRAELTPQGAEMLDLYMPLVVGPRAGEYVLAHLAQSLDGRVATGNGKSQFISAHHDLVHTHRLRALFDAVLVGASTVQHDNPRLTTRMCDGPNPVRVVLDPRGRLRDGFRLFEDAPQTLVIRGKTRGRHRAPPRGDTVSIIELQCDDDGRLPIDAVLETLRTRGLHRIFIEGGGVTVSNFLTAQALDRLHIAVAPMIIGSGRPGFTLPDIDDLNEALRFRARHFSMGPDILFDCPLQPAR